MIKKLSANCSYAGLEAIVDVDYLYVEPTLDNPMQKKFIKNLRTKCNIDSKCTKDCPIFANAPQIIEA